MKCPFCSDPETKVIDKRESGINNRRRRECAKCMQRFTTYERLESLITKIRKRNGRLVDFDQGRITSAIFAAAQSVGGKDRELAKKLSDKVVSVLEDKFGGLTIPHVEQVQDIVEKILVEEGHYKTAKSYIIYRKEHEKIREFKTPEGVNPVEGSKWDRKKVIIYLCGSLKKNEKEVQKNDWQESQMSALRNELKGYDVIFLNPRDRKDDLNDYFSSFGRDMLQVISSDFVIADCSDKRGIGVGAEMITAKLHKIPLIAIVPEGSHYNKKNIEMLGQRIENFKHSFAYSIPDAIVVDTKSAASWIRGYLKEQKPIKDISVIAKAIHHYEDTQLEKDIPMKEIMQKIKSK